MDGNENLGAPSTMELNRERSETEEIAEKLREQIDIRRNPDYVPGDSDDEFESILPFIFESPLVELPLIRILSVLYTCYNANLLFKAYIGISFLKINNFIKNNSKVISVCSVIVLSMVLLSYYLASPVHCDAPRA
jgi:hypothetical protein